MEEELTVPKRICYVFGELPQLSANGISMVSYRLARNIRKRGWEVHLVVNRRPASRNTELLDGMIVHRVHYPPAPQSSRARAKIRWYMLRLADILSSGHRGLYSYHDLIDALADADADIYVQVGSDAWTGYVSEFAKTMRRPFIFVASHIDDCELTTGGRPKLWEAYDKHTREQYLQGLRRSDAIAVLANYMKDALPAEFRAKCHVIPFGDEPPQEETLRKKSDSPFVLWTSGMRVYKRPYELLDIASRLPQVEFVVCGIGPLYEAFKAKAATFSNVKVKGAILSFMEMDELFAGAALTLNTSESEGFPDTFTRSWMNATPVVTVRVDPDEVICRERLGYHSGTCDQAARDIAKLVTDSTLRTQIGERCRAFAIRNLHIEATVESNVRLYEQLLSTCKG